jgi:hypothetical protein
LNFPDLETCKAISDEFPDSEFVWVESIYFEGNFDDVRSTQMLSVWKRENAGIYDPSGHSKRIICPAPTCEELGEFIHKQRPQIGGQNEYHYTLEARAYEKDSGYWVLWFDDFQIKIELGDFYAANETQARAEAVKLILNKGE